MYKMWTGFILKIGRSRGLCPARWVSGYLQMQALGVQPRFEQVQRVQQGQVHDFQVETNRQLRYQTVLQAFGLAVDGSIYADAGIVCDRGFCTDAFLKTSVENIYAIGDCAQVNGIQLQYVAPIRAQAKACEHFVW